ncbi:MAG: UDP-N-acetylmuramoyl-L-alanine--D-glutamate ligase, partial [Planctomycetota bacterium]
MSANRPQRVVVMGLGLFGGGAAVARYFTERGARVLVTDLRDEETLRPGIEAVGDARSSIEWVLGAHRESDFVAADLVVANPAVPPDNRFLNAARAAGVRITSETELFLDECRARLAVVTGTQGKSSTSSMTSQLLNACGMRAHLCGNVGRSLLEQAAKFDPDDLCVLEISSYQLEALGPRFEEQGGRSFENIAVVALTGVLEDHLERHGSLENYARAKARLFDLPQRAFALLPESGLPAPIANPSRAGLERVPFDPLPRSKNEKAQSPPQRAARRLWIEAGEFRFGRGESAGFETLGFARDLELPGEFQKSNALVALGIARLLGAPADKLRNALSRLHGLPHRMERLEAAAGRTVYDNGVSTTPDSTVAALASLPNGSVLLCGGKAKALCFDELTAECATRSLRVVTFGAAAHELAEQLRARVVEARPIPDLSEATAAALAWSAPGDTLLFSPACASFDAFPNFAARAKCFRSALEGAAARLDEQPTPSR